MTFTTASDAVMFRDGLVAAVRRVCAADGLPLEHLWAGQVRHGSVTVVAYLLLPRPVEALAAGLALAGAVEHQTPGYVCTDCALLAL
ncbi:hypothetical protein V1J52_12680 [Streptomyces sp. TRM 70351]|uniref:hypothetical protein n=1 Tax=Streptomyces sp. TRM 70351 TaxID=3116552 RepID=UPI002E7C46F3|nr:hypothetical protein [Streptomyces sp. TRM 70351]MEE1929023.1 hypothetical protein [Streptomyces sp. TRM 70351]